MTEAVSVLSRPYFLLSESSASGAAGGSDTEGKAAKGSGERGGSRESFKSAVVKKLGAWNGLKATLKKYLSQSWWVPSGIFALGGGSTFMPA